MSAISEALCSIRLIPSILIFASALAAVLVAAEAGDDLVSSRAPAPLATYRTPFTPLRMSKRSSAVPFTASLVPASASSELTGETPPAPATTGGAASTPAFYCGVDLPEVACHCDSATISSLACKKRFTAAPVALFRPDPLVPLVSKVSPPLPAAAGLEARRLACSPDAGATSSPKRRVSSAERSPLHNPVASPLVPTPFKSEVPEEFALISASDAPSISAPTSPAVSPATRSPLAPSVSASSAQASKASNFSAFPYAAASEVAHTAPDGTSRVAAAPHRTNFHIPAKGVAYAAPRAASASRAAPPQPLTLSGSDGAFSAKASPSTSPAEGRLLAANSSSVPATVGLASHATLAEAPLTRSGNGSITDAKIPEFDAGGPRAAAAASSAASVPAPGDAVVAGLRTTDMLSAITVAAAEPAGGEETAEGGQQQLVAVTAEGQTKETFACCAGTWPPDSRLENPPAVDIGGPVYKGEDSSIDGAGEDQDKAFLEQFAKAKEEFSAAFLKKRRGYSRRHQAHPTTAPPQAGKVLVASSIDTSIDTSAGPPAAAAVAAPPVTGGRYSHDGRRRRGNSAAGGKPAAATTPAVDTAAHPPAGEPAAAGKTAATSSRRSRTVPPSLNSDTSSREEAGARFVRLPGQRARRRPHITGEVGDSVTSNSPVDSRNRLDNSQKTEEAYGSAPTAGSRSTTAADLRNSVGERPSHSDATPAQPRKHATTDSYSKALAAKGEGNRLEADPGTRSVRHTNENSTKDPQTIEGHETQRYSEKRTSHGEKRLKAEEQRVASRSADDVRSSRAASSAPGTLRRRPRTADLVDEQRNFEGKDRHVNPTLGGSPKAAATPTSSIAKVAAESPVLDHAALPPTAPVSPPVTATTAGAALRSPTATLSHTPTDPAEALRAALLPGRAAQSATSTASIPAGSNTARNRATPIKLNHTSSTPWTAVKAVPTSSPAMFRSSPSWIAARDLPLQPVASAAVTTAPASAAAQGTRLGQRGTPVALTVPKHPEPPKSATILRAVPLESARGPARTATRTA